MAKQREQPSQRNASSQSWHIYMASAFGAFCLGFSDLLTNEGSATVMRIEQILRQYFGLGVESGLGALIPLVFIVIMGTLACWVYSPESRVDGFMRGFSVFAILSVVSPIQLVTGDNLPGSAGQEGAMHSTGAPFIQLVQDRQIGTAEINIITSAAADRQSLILHITVREAESAIVVVDKRVSGRTFMIEQRYGRYNVEVEVEGYRRVIFNVNISEQEKTYELLIEPSRMPLRLQRLIAPRKATLRSVS